MKYLKKISCKIKFFFFYLIQGLIAADKIIRSDKGSETSPINSIEQQKEEQNVLKDLLKGVVTDEVRELRHEMYYSERKSHEYVYGGGGRSKKNNIFEYTGKIEKSDGYNIKLVQENKELIKSLEEEGIVVHGTNVNIDKSLSKNVNVSKKMDSKYILNISRDFIPRFFIERYTSKIVVKEADNEYAIIDLYVSQYKQQFNNVSKLFQSEMDKIYQGNKRSEIIQFDKLSFVTNNCYGVPDMLLFEYDNIKFDNIIKFDGSYVLRFYCHVLTDGHDMIEQFYDEKTALKNEKHEMRNGAVITYDTALSNKMKEDLDTSDVEKLIKDVNYPHLKERASCFSDTPCIKVPLNVLDVSPQA